MVKQKSYHLNEKIATLIVRPRGLHLPEKHLLVEGNEVSGSLVDFGLYVYQHQQTKVDELKLQVAEMKSRLNDAYTDGQSAMYTARQSKIYELQKMVDAVKALIEEYRDPPTEDKTFQHALSIVAYELEQALKGDQ